MRLFVVLLLAGLLPVQLPAAPAASPDGLAALDALIDEAIREEQIPGAVLVVGTKGRVVYRKAFGNRVLVPQPEPMTLDTIFDAASLTKVVATSTAIARLFEQGKVRLSDPVTAYLPEYQGGRSAITVRHLLTHFSGLRPDVDLRPEWSGQETGIRLALADKPRYAPGEQFVYSDINFVLLGEIVRRVSGKTLDEFCRDQIFRPLGMTETMYRPPATLRGRIAPTEQYPGMTEPLRGVVHDETTRFMGGVAGHAGLFTTADDLARFAEMMLGKGQRNGVRVLSPVTVAKMTTPQTPAYQTVLRGLGWDIDSPFSTNRGELFPIGSYGHTGFTGTSLWIDPASQTYVILLANSVHPYRRPAITPLRSKVATVAAAALGVTGPEVLLTGYYETLVGAGGARPVARVAQVDTGLDVMADGRFAALRGQRVGLITNHTGMSRDGRRNLDVMLQAGVRVAALFSPEHGIAGREDHENVGNAVDAATKVPIYSLYAGATRAPNAEMLQQVDVLVFDIQDVGARFYTYMCTMVNAMEAAAKTGKPFIVLDRPNPITGTRVEGPMLDADRHSFIGCAALPVRHGMTLGELARMVAAERNDGLQLTVVPMRNWRRGDWWDSTGLAWRDPSPNMRSLNAALLYPGLAMLEYSRNWSVGRGTDSPFEQVGADWLDGRKLAEHLNRRKVPGVRAYPTEFTPASSNLAGKRVQGVRFVVTDREVFHATRLGLEVAAALGQLYPGKIDLVLNRNLIGSQATIDALRRGADPRAIVQGLDEQMQAFVERRRGYLLY